MMLAHVEREPPPPSRFRPDLPSEFERVVLDCLRKDRRERPEHCRQLREGLEAALVSVDAARVTRVQAADASPCLHR